MTERAITHLPDMSAGIVGRPKPNLPPYMGEGEDLAAKWYGIFWDGTETTEEELDSLICRQEYHNAHMTNYSTRDSG